MITFTWMMKSSMLKGFSQMVITIVVIGFTISLMDKVNYGGRVNVFPLEIGFVAKQWGKAYLWPSRAMYEDNFKTGFMDGDGTYRSISGTAWSYTITRSQAIRVWSSRELLDWISSRRIRDHISSSKLWIQIEGLLSESFQVRFHFYYLFKMMTLPNIETNGHPLRCSSRH